MTLDEFIRRLENLRVDRSRGPAKPYKPLLVLAVVMLIEKGEIADGRILLDGALKSVFDQLLRNLFPAWPYRADIRLPFRHLESDGIWRLVPAPHALDDFMAAQSAGAKAPQLLRSVACAELDAEVAAALVTSSHARRRVIDAVAKHLPASEMNPVLALVADGTRPESDTPPEVPPAHALEREVEEYLSRRWDATPFAEMGIELCFPEKHGCAGRQRITPVNAIDLLGFRPVDHAWWIFELKKGRPGDAVVGQVSRYKGWLEEDRASRAEPVRGAIIAGDADPKLRYAAKSAGIDVWVYDSRLALRRVS
jgi:hypothetical protein